MDKFSIVQNIERIPELRFKYIGSNPADQAPKLPNYSFASINSAPSNDREHWMMIAR